MSIEFLSDEWFVKVAELRAEAGDVEVPASLADLAININVTTDAGEKQLALVGGMIEEGHADGAPTTMSLPADLAQKILIEGDQAAGIDRKSTRLNSSHVSISYAVFCLQN